MTSLSQLHRDYSALQDLLGATDMGWTPPALQPVTVSHEVEELGHSALQDRLRGLEEGSGWLMFPDRIIILPSAVSEPPMPPLAGEWVTASGKSARLEHMGGDAWRIHTATVAETTPEAATHLAERVVHRNDARAPAPLEYLRLWTTTAEGAPAPTMGLFIGFQEQQA